MSRLAIAVLALAACTAPPSGQPTTTRATTASETSAGPAEPVSLSHGRQLLDRLRRLPQGVPPRLLLDDVQEMRRDCRRLRADLEAEATVRAHLVLAACLNLDSDEFLEAPDSAMAVSYLELAFSEEAFDPASRRHGRQ